MSLLNFKDMRLKNSANCLDSTEMSLILRTFLRIRSIHINKMNSKYSNNLDQPAAKYTHKRRKYML